jgi:hypothetical protein
MTVFWVRQEGGLWYGYVNGRPHFKAERFNRFWKVRELYGAWSLRCDSLTTAKREATEKLSRENLQRA